MIDSLQRIAAIVRADFLIRFRRVSTVVVFLALCFIPYLLIPDPRTGTALVPSKAFMQIDGRRALLNSATIGMGTALIGSVFIGLIGFYVISNAIRRDVLSRCGAVIASTRVRSIEYLVGKTLGNVVFLVTFVSGFMLASMAMVIVRGEAPLEPLVFIGQYLLLVPPAIVTVSVIAVVFESIPWLSGRLGDVLYFFLWMGLFVPVAALSEKSSSPAPNFVAYFDVSGLGYMVAQMKNVLHTTAVAIGSSTLKDPSLAPTVFNGLGLPANWILPRISSTFTPTAFTLIALAFFHRFDPARTGRIVSRAGEGILRRVQRWIKPVTRPVVAAVMGRPRAGHVTLVGSARRDAALTLGAFPFAALALIGFSLVGLAMRPAEVGTGLMPILIAVIAVIIADVPCRERRAGTMNLVCASPLLASAFVRWKFLAALIVTALFVMIPAVKVAIAAPQRLVALVIGLVFIASASTMLGTVSSNPKTFIVLFLTFWYVVMNDEGRTPQLDFAGFFGTSTSTVIVAYALMAIAFYAVAEVVYAAQRRREG